MSSGNWLEELEARLEQQLETFLRSNPDQEALLAEQEARDRQARLLQNRRSLQRQAEQQRQALLHLADEIHRWQERVQRARTAGAAELAIRADAHVDGLMDQGRRRWKELTDLGESFQEVQLQLEDLSREQRAAQQSRKTPPGNLEDDWRSFEAQQELERLRQRMGR